MKKKTRYPYQAPLAYGHDNIASMILKTLTTRADLLPSTSKADIPECNKCKYCDKVFLNQLYLQSHINRRHSNLVDAPQRDDENGVLNNNVNSILTKEIIELKNKLKEMEAGIAETHKMNLLPSVMKPTEINNSESVKEHKKEEKSMKDAEVSTSNDEYILSKIEEWKTGERQKYDKELNDLKTQIMETIHLMKQNDGQNKSDEKDPKIIEQLQIKVAQQDSEILTLKKELNESVSILMYLHN